MPLLKGKVAVVTGGASGIGRGLAEQLIADGMRVVIADIEQAALEQTALEIGAIAVATDVTSFDSMQALADRVRQRFGAVHLFCSNAGVASTASVAAMSLADWAWILNVNLWGFIHGIKAFLPLLESNPEGGHLAVTASVAGLHITPDIGGYTVSKFAVIALAETLALELEAAGTAVGVTILCPGPVSSKLGYSQRNRPAADGVCALVDRDLERADGGSAVRWLSPASVADLLVDAIRSGELYVFTHPEWAPIVQARHDRLAAAFNRGGNRCDP